MSRTRHHASNGASFLAVRKIVVPIWILLVLFAGLLGFSKMVRAASYEQIARNWAPIVFQDTDRDPIYNVEARYDQLTRFDYDGDSAGTNNEDHADLYPLVAYVYYDVRETETHYFIMYAFYHTYDRHLQHVSAVDKKAEVCLPSGEDAHENDLEGVILCVRKGGEFGTLRSMASATHGGFYTFHGAQDESIVTKVAHADRGYGSRSCWLSCTCPEPDCSCQPPDTLLRAQDGHPVVFIEEGGHGVGSIFRALESDAAGDISFDGEAAQWRFRGNDGIVYKLAPVGTAAEVPTGPDDRDVKYNLLPMADLWDWQSDPAVRDQVYSINTIGYGVCGLTGLRQYFNSTELAANPPWAWKDHDGNNDVAMGDFFFDPAFSFRNLFARFDDQNLEGYDSYLTNDYLNWDCRIDLAGPASGACWAIGQTKTISWSVYIDPRTSGIHNNVRIELSRDNGLSYTQIGEQLYQAGSFPWVVQGPVSSQCKIRIVGSAVCTIVAPLYGTMESSFAIYDGRILSAPNVAGTSSSKTFSVTYACAANLAPEYVNLQLVGESTPRSLHKFIPGDNDYTDGVVYVSDPIQFGPGTYHYKFCSNTAGFTAICTPICPLEVQGASGVAVTLSPNPVAVGQHVTITATVTSGGGPVVGEDVQFSQLPNYSGGFSGGNCGVYCATTNSSGQATITYTPSSFGTIRLIAEAESGVSGYSDLVVTSQGYNMALTATLDEMGPPSEYVIRGVLTQNGTPVHDADVTFSADHGIFTFCDGGSTCQKSTAADGSVQAVLQLYGYSSPSDYNENISVCLQMDLNPAVRTCVSFKPTCPPSVCPPPAMAPFDTLALNCYDTHNASDDRSGGLRWNNDGSKIAAGSGTKIRIMDYPANSSYCEKEYQGWDAIDLTWKPDGTKLCATFQDRFVIYDPLTCNFVSPTPVDEGSEDLTACAWDGTNVICVQNQTSIRQYTESGAVTNPNYLPIPDMTYGYCNAVDYCPLNGRVAVTGPQDDLKKVYVYNSGGSLYHAWEFAPDAEYEYYDCDWSPDGTRLVACGEAGILRVFKMSDYSSAPIPYFSSSTEVFGCRFIDNNTVAAVGSDGKLLIWDLTTSSYVAQYGCNGTPVDLDFDDNNDILAVGTGSEKTFLFNLSNDVAGPLVSTQSIGIQPYGADSVTVSGNMSDPHGICEAYIIVHNLSMEVLAVDESGSFEKKVALQGDSTMVQIVGRDFYRNETRSTINIMREPDTTPPIISETTVAPDSVFVGDNAFVSARVVDFQRGVNSDSVLAMVTKPDLSHMRYRLYDDATHGDVQALDSVFSCSIGTAGFALGSYQVAVKAQDSAPIPNVRTTDIIGSFYVYRIDTLPPVISNVSVTPATVSVGSSVTASAKIVDRGYGVNPDSTIAYVRKPNLTVEPRLMNDAGQNGDVVAGDSIYTAVFAVAAPDTGSNMVSIGASDLSSPPNASVTGYLWSYVVQPHVNHAPVLDPIPSIAVTACDTVTIIAHATDPDGTPLTYSIDDPRYSKNINVFRWGPAVADSGRYYPIVTVSDGALTDTQAVVVIVTPCISGRHDPMAASDNTWFGWVCRKAAWHPEEDGYLNATTAAWDAAVVSTRVLGTDSDPYVVFRFQHSTSPGTNYMFGFTDNAPSSSADSAKFDYHNMKRGFYANSGGTLYKVYNGHLYSKGSLASPGTYDLKIELGSDGVTHFTIDDVSSYAAPLSDFATPVWADTAHWSLASSYHIQINPYNATAKVYDVWAESNVENRAPVLDPISSIAVTAYDTVIIVANATDPDGDPLTYSINDTRYTRAANVFRWVPTAIDVGTYYPIVSVSDGALIDTQTVVVSVVSGTSSKRDHMAANDNAWFDWMERKGAWHVEQDGYFNATTAAWDAGVVSGRVVPTSDDPCMVFRFEHSTSPGTNYMFGFTDNAPSSSADSAKFDYHNMKRGFYVNSGGTLYKVYNGHLYSKGSLASPGTYDLKIELGSDGVTHFTIDEVSSYAAPLSDFSAPVWADTAHWSVASSYHIQINPYNASAKVYDVWELPYTTPVEDLPTRNLLAQNYPNPFNPTTTVTFSLGKALYTELRIYDVKGRLVRTLLASVVEPGPHDVIWDGKDSSGRSVPSGVYFCQLIAGTDTQTRKMVILR